MLVIRDQIQPTIQRYEARRQLREANKRKLKTGLILDADTPERVEKRVKRLAQSEIGRETLTRLLGRPVEVDDPSRQLGLERVLGKSDLISVSYLELGLQVAKSIGRVQIRTGSGRTVGYGTGFLVAPRLLMTNNHVLSEPQEASFSRVEFNYQDGADGSRQESLVYDLNPGLLFITDRELDYTLVAVRDREDRILEFGYNPLIEQEGKAIVGEYVTIIQHPRGEPKQIALRENRLVDVLDEHLHYETDTAQGSSGSPVFNDAWEVIALHHMGVPRRDGQGNYLMKDGSLWQDGMDDSLIDWVANEGVRASRLAKHIQGQSLAVAQKQLCEPMFGSRPLLRADEYLPREASGTGEGTPVLQPDGSALWTVPIQVSVRVGGGVQRPRAGPALAAARPISADRERPVAERPPRVPAGESPELLAAIEEARRARQRPYYAKEKDGADRKAYYQGEPADAGSEGWYQWLSELLTQTHDPKPAYKPSRLVYPWVDLHEDRRLRSIYSGRTFDPEELIRADFEVDRRREQLREAFLLEAAGTGRSLEEAADLLEASLPYNCEHVVPQSWFAKKEPMRGDLHHLYACESGCNSFRGNIPYYDFPDFEEAIRDECGKREQGGFEPGHSKGVVARATLYFLLRYPGEINQTAKEYTEDRIHTLLQWHADQEPGDYERHRNAAIFELQGNRNPLIDHPEWAARVDFRHGLGEP